MLRDEGEYLCKIEDNLPESDGFGWWCKTAYGNLKGFWVGLGWARSVFGGFWYALRCLEDFS